MTAHGQILKYALFIGLLIVSPFGLTDVLTGRVVGVADGDTLTLLQGGRTQTRIRLAQIDAPEKSQAFGQKSKASLSDLVFNKEVKVSVETTDRYGRTVGTVFLGEQDINLKQVERGFAWVYRRYAHDPAYEAAEARARTKGLGLWSEPDPMPPWEYRHPARGQGRKPTQDGGPPASEVCPADQRCKAFSTCEAVMHWVGRCGLGRLDGDHDGIPCESLCSPKAPH